MLEPYGFGECHEITVMAPISCEAWEDENHLMKVIVRKEGNKHTIVFNEYTAKNKTGYNAKVQEVVVD